jgi:poly(A) polymerase
MIRAIALAARLDFTIEPKLLHAIRTHRQEIAKSSSARLLEEYYKILRAGSSEKAFRSLAEVGLLEPISPELHRGADEALWRSLRELDAYRKRFESTPATLTNSILMGSLLVPLGIPLYMRRADDRPHPGQGRTDDRPLQGHRPAPSPEHRGEAAPDHHAGLSQDHSGGNAVQRGGNPGVDRRRASGPRLGTLPLARRDIERLRQATGLQRRLNDLTVSPRAQRALAHRSIFGEALTWLEIHGGAPEAIEHWKALLTETGNTEPALDGGTLPPVRRRRRRRRRRHPFVPTGGR